MTDNIAGPTTRPYADTIQKSWNDPESAIFGQGKFGECYFGDDSAGVFQTFKSTRGKASRKLRYYVPTYSESEPIIASRTKFANAILAYRALTAEQKNDYKILAYGKQMSGYNLFLRKYMLT
jgi:hypothetical protein